MTIRKGNPLRKHELVNTITKGLSTTRSTIYRKKAYGGDAGFCQRKTVLCTLVDPEFEVGTSPSSALYMAIGTAVHEQIAKALKQSGTLMGEEVRVEDERIGPPTWGPLAGYIDNIVMYDEKVTLIEVKTCGKPPSAPKPGHKEQASTYAIMSGIDHAQILYVSRNVADWNGSLIMKAFPLEFNEENLRPIARRLAITHYYMGDGVIPPIPTHLASGKSCGYCPFNSFCHNPPFDLPLTKEEYEPETFKPEDIEALEERLINERPYRLDKLLGRLEMY